MAHNVAVEGSRIERPIKFFIGAVVFHWPEEGARLVRAMLSEGQIFLDQPLRRGVSGNEPDLIPFALDAEMRHALTGLQIPNLKAAKFLAADAVIEQGGENGAIAQTFERIGRRSIEQFASLGVAE